MRTVKLFSVLIFLAVTTTGFSYFQDIKTPAQRDSLIDIVERNDNSITVAQALNALSNFYYFSDLDSAAYFATRARDIISGIDEMDSFKIHIYNNIGRINVVQGNYDKGMANFIEALKLSEKNNYFFHLIIIRVNLGALYDRQKSYDEAFEQYNLALSLIDEKMKQDSSPNVHIFKSNIYNNIANIYSEKKDTVNMIKAYVMALEENALIDDMETKSIILNNLGKSYIDQGDAKRGKSHIDEALSIKKKLNDVKGMAQCYRNLGYYFYTFSNYDSAIFYYNLGLESSLNSNTLKDIVDMYDGLANSYEGLNQTAEALEFYKLYKSYSDSLYNDTKAIEITRLQNTYEFEKEQEKLMLEQKNQVLKLVLSIGILMLLVLLAMFIVFFQRSKIKNSQLRNDHLELQQISLQLQAKNLNMELDHKSKELTTTVLYLFKKNELITHIIEELYELKNRMLPENKTLLNRIVKSLNGLTTDNSWSEFETRFNEVHNDFYVVLQNQFPDITPNERKLCAFLKLNMTSKEISSLTGQSIRSIDVARTRLRKKLNLTNSTVNLVDFLSDL